MPRRTRWLLAVLCISVAFNLSLVGFLLGRTTASANLDPGMGIQRVLSHLPEDRVNEVLAQVAVHRAESRREIRTLMRGVQRRRNEAWSLLMHEELDAEAMAQALEAYRAAMADAQRNMDRWTVLLVSSLSVEERRRLLKLAGPDGLLGVDANGMRPRPHTDRRSGGPRLPRHRKDRPAE